MPPDTRYTSDSDLESVLSLNDTVKLKNSSAEGKYKCSVCAATFKRLDKLDAHEYKHTGIKKHACTYTDCDKVYSILTHLKRHIRTTHERTAPLEKNVRCSIESCDKLFTSICNMQRHVKEVHENPKVYFCSHCGEKFTQKLKLRRHEIQKHTGVYPYNCEKCGKGLYHQWQYERHVSVCKVYTCLECHKKFDKWTIFRKHCSEEKHDFKYYKCDKCQCTFVKPSALQQHLARKHINDDNENSNDSNSNEGASKLYKCSYEGCERSYAYQHNLHDHQKIAHSGKRFECKESNCKRSFTSLRNLKKHLERAVHGENDTAKTKMKKKTKKGKQNKRKDCGKPVVSNLAIMSGIQVDRECNKLLRDRDEAALDIVAEKLLEEIVATET